jgi:sensor histidine kinase regulating citrate/malate metabolism
MTDAGAPLQARRFAIPFAARLAAVVVAVIILASVLAVVLNDLKFRQVIRRQEGQVFAFIAADLRDTIQDSMNLGLPLAMLQNTQGMIERRRQSEADVTSITVYDTRGIVLYDTDRARVGTAVPGAWRPAAATQATWSAELPAMSLVGARIVNSFGQPAGAVILGYDPHEMLARGHAILVPMRNAALLAGGFTIVVAIVIVTLLTRPLRRWFALASAEIIAEPHDDATPELAADMKDFAAATAQAETALSQATQEMQALALEGGQAPSGTVHAR